MINKIFTSTTQQFILSGIVLLGSLSFSGQAAAAELAYSWANQPTKANYTAPGGYSFNAGQPVEMSRSSTGKYRVKFGRVATTGATVQVSAYGEQTGYCTIKNWNGGSVNVWCFDGNNRLADRQFSILAIKGQSVENNKLAYAWLQDGEMSSYTASSGYRLGNGSMDVSRSNKGRYQVKLGSPVGEEAAVLASGYGGRIHCGIVNWGSGTARVICNNTDTIAADSQATVLAIKNGFPGASFVWNSNATGEADVNYSQASNGSSQSVTKLSAGRYRVVLGPEAALGGNIQVSAYQTGVTCWPEVWHSGQVTVRCAKGTTLIDSQFVVLGLKATTPRVGGTGSEAEWRRIGRTLAAETWELRLADLALPLESSVDNFIIESFPATETTRVDAPSGNCNPRLEITHLNGIGLAFANPAEGTLLTLDPNRRELASVDGGRTVSALLFSTLVRPPDDIKLSYSRLPAGSTARYEVLLRYITLTAGGAAICERIPPRRP